MFNVIQSDYCAWCKLVVFQLRARKINHRINYDSPLNDSSFISDIFLYRFIQMLFWRLLVIVSLFTTGHIYILKTTGVCCRKLQSFRRTTQESLLSAEVLCSSSQKQRYFMSEKWVVTICHIWVANTFSVLKRKDKLS